MSGSKARKKEFAACPGHFHEILRFFEDELKKMGITNPKTQAEEFMAQCFHLSLDTVKDAKRGRGPYARGKPCEVSDCDGKKDCLLGGETAAREVLNRKRHSTTKLPH